jgi:erythronate-4-phosphate dehydrogenase
MKILADRNIPLAEELFGSLGDVVLVEGRDVTESFPNLDQFDILAIRSVTRVTPKLVDRAVKAGVIATATIGTDHIDLPYIQEANRRRRSPITVLSAPGSNADSVADYIWYGLAYLTRGSETPLNRKSLGIIGLGNCGSRVARRAEGFGMRILRYDPPLAERDPLFTSDTFEDAMAADFVTLHVPLTQPCESNYPTQHMIGAAALSLMKGHAYLLNASRGAVVDSRVLVRALKDGAVAGAVLDVYEGEPQPAPELISLPALATPHIAGYAIEAKRRGATAIYERVCRVLGIEPQDTRPLLLRGFDPPKGVQVRFRTHGHGAASAADADHAVRSLMASIHDISATSRELKETLRFGRREELFDRMRRDYERDYARHELAFYRVGFDESVPPELRAAVARRLEGFGIEVMDRELHYVLSAS